MHMFFCSTAFVLIAQLSPDFRDRERHPLAPSLPVLTKEESKQIDAVIDRFIQYDIGALKGAEGKKALDAFNRLGPEATFNLIHGLNRAANMESSCPAVIIAKKLASIYLTTDDLQLLGYSKDLIGVGVTGKRHLGVIRDLQTNILLRKGYVQRRALAQGGTKSVASMSLAELERVISKESGAKLKAALTEADKRSGPKAIDLLIMGIANPDADLSRWTRGLLDKRLQRESAATIKLLLQDKRRDVRLSAIATAAEKKLRLGNELIGLLQDADIDIREASRQALVRMSGGLDFGPETSATVDEREAASARWRDWWSKQK